MPGPDVKDLRESLAHYMTRIYKQGLTTASGGNLSARDADGNIWVTPARIDKATITAEDIVCVSTDREVLHGRHEPTSELHFHLAIYRARPDLSAIVHAHPVSVVAYSAARLLPETAVLPATARKIGLVRLAAYALPGSEQLGSAIASEFTAGAACVVLENHGVVAAGMEIADAFERFERLDRVAQSLLRSKLLGDLVVPNTDPMLLSHPSAGVSQLDSRPPITEQESQLRGELSHVTRRAYDRRLMSTEGAISGRIGVGSMIISPANINCSRLESSDFVYIESGDAEPGKMPAAAWQTHAAIYEHNPDICCVISASPISATAFAITGTTFKSNIIPESYLVLREVATLSAGDTPADVARALSMRNPVVMVMNSGVHVGGCNAIDAFDRLEVLESTARAIIDCQLLGTMHHLSDQAIAELKQRTSPNAYGAVWGPQQ